MSDDRPQAPGGDNDANDEAAMRRALGIGGRGAGQGAPVQQRPDQARQRHRFVQDGEVPVVMLGRAREAEPPRPARPPEGEAGLAAERQARLLAERSATEAQAASRAWQTKFEHAELTHREAMAAKDAALAAARAQAEEALAALHAAEESNARSARPSEPTRRARLQPGERPARSGREPQPVKWWLPNYGSGDATE